MQQAGAGALLAKVMEGRGLNAEEEEEEIAEEQEEEEEEQEQEESSSEETISSASISSYESTEVPLFEKSHYNPLEYKPPPENVEAWKKLPVDYCGRLLLETKQKSGVQARKKGTQAYSMMRAKPTELSDEPAYMFLMAELRGPALLFYLAPEPKAPKKKWTPAFLCVRAEPEKPADKVPKQWEYLCSVVLDETAEMQLTTMEGNSASDYKAIQISARIVHTGESASFSQANAETSTLPKNYLALREKYCFSGFLSADTEAETEEWMAMLNGRKALSQYLLACEETSQRPLEPVAASLLSQGPREIILEGVPFQEKIDQAIFSCIKVPYLAGVYCGWRGMDAADLAACFQNMSCTVRILDLTANEFGCEVLDLLCNESQRLIISHLTLAENNLSGSSQATEGLASLLASPDPLCLDLRRTALVDDSCIAMAKGLRTVQQPGLVSKTVSMGENDLTEKGIKELAAGVADTLPRLKVICLPNIPQLGAEKFPAILQEVPLLRPGKLSAKYPPFPFRSLDEAEIPERCLKMPAVLSGRLFVETGGNVVDAAGQQGETPSLFLAFFELRGPLLLRYAVPPRSTANVATKGTSISGQPRGTLTHAFGEGLAGIVILAAKLSSSKLTVTGKKVLSNVLVSQGAQPETWVLQGESADYLQEWFRVLTLR